MKLISIMVPTYNEEDNVIPLSQALVEQFKTRLPRYDYEIVFIDNHSTDSTRDRIEELCKGNKKIKAIFNSKNFGVVSSQYYGLCQMTGDCVIPVCADFQDPIDMIPRFVEEWESGYKIVCGVKTDSEENRIMRLFRSFYYKFIRKVSNVNIIEHFTGFGLYDKTFIEVLRNLNDPIPFLRGIVTELGPERKLISYTQPKRRTGKSKLRLNFLYDYAMLSFTSYTKIGMRVATMLGFCMSIISLLIALLYLILKLIYWNDFPMGNAPIIIGVFVLGAMQLFFIGLLGEYVMSINIRLMNRPLVIEDRRINFDADKRESKKQVKVKTGSRKVR